MATQRSGTNINDLARLNPANYTPNDLIVIRSATNQKAMQTTVDEFSTTIKGTNAFMVVDSDTVITEDNINLFEYILVDTALGDVSITLPTAVNVPGKSVSIKKISTLNTANIIAEGASLIDGDATASLIGDAFPLAGLLCDGIDWWITNA